MLLAACRPSESAFEFPFDGVESNGALTYWLLDSLRQLGPGLTYRQLYGRIAAKVHSQFRNQTPQLEGEGDRVVFGADRVAAQRVVNVTAVDGQSKRVQLNAGQAHGIRRGAQFAVYPIDVLDVTQVERRLALVEVQDPGAVDSWAAIAAELRPDPIEPGARAVLLDIGTVRTHQSVRAVRREDLPSSVDQEAALAAVEQAIDSAGGFLRRPSDDEPADFQVLLGEDGGYEIWDAAGRPVPNLPPGAAPAGPDAAASTVRRLVHLARYKIVQQLDNLDPMSPLARKLVVELAGVQQEYEPGERPDLRPLAAGGDQTVEEGAWAFVRIRNDARQVLNIAALDLQPDWGIAQVYPAATDTDWLPLDPGEETLLPLRAARPEQGQEGPDVIKVFATTGPTSFRWLELPAMEQQDTRTIRSRSGQALNPLEALFASITTTAPTTRTLNPAAYPSRGWVTASLELRVMPPRPQDGRQA